MLVFIDDSGDPGFKFAKGSTRYFVMACVIFDDDLDAEETSLKIKRSRRELGWRDDHEFKFNKCSKEIRLKFMKQVGNCNFRIRAIVADKTLVKSPELRTDRNSFYNFMIKELLAASEGSIVNASIRLDGHEDRHYKKAASAYFRKYANPGGRIIKSTRFVNSKGNNLIQLADMIAGAIHRSKQTEKNDNKDYIYAFKSKIENIIDFK
jgi:hypothetical protein